MTLNKAMFSESSNTRDLRINVVSKDWQLRIKMLVMQCRQSDTNILHAARHHLQKILLQVLH